MKCSAPVLWTETVKFTDVLPDDPRRLLITDICYAIDGDVVRLDGLGGHASHMYSAQGLTLSPGLWVAEADAMHEWGTRCYRSRIRLASRNWPALHTTTQEHEQGVDAGMVSYVFAKPGDTETYDPFKPYLLPIEQMVLLRNEYGHYASPNVKRTWRESTTEQDMQHGFVTATTQSGDGDGGYPVILKFLGGWLVQAETWFLWDDEGDD